MRRNLNIRLDGLWLNANAFRCSRSLQSAARFHSSRNKIVYSLTHLHAWSKPFFEAAHYFQKINSISVELMSSAFVWQRRENPIIFEQLSALMPWIARSHIFPWMKIWLHRFGLIWRAWTLLVRCIQGLTLSSSIIIACSNNKSLRGSFSPKLPEHTKRRKQKSSLIASLFKLVFLLLLLHYFVIIARGKQSFIVHFTKDFK